MHFTDSVIWGLRTGLAVAISSTMALVFRSAFEATFLQTIVALVVIGLNFGQTIRQSLACLIGVVIGALLSFFFAAIVSTFSEFPLVFLGIGMFLLGGFVLLLYIPSLGQKFGLLTIVLVLWRFARGDNEDFDFPFRLIVTVLAGIGASLVAAILPIPTLAYIRTRNEIARAFVCYVKLLRLLVRAFISGGLVGASHVHAVILTRSAEESLEHAKKYIKDAKYEIWKFSRVNKYASLIALLEEIGSCTRAITTAVLDPTFERVPPDLFKGVRTSLSGVAIAIAQIVEQLGDGLPDHADALNGKYSEASDTSSSKGNVGSENGGENLRHSASNHSSSAPMAKKDHKDAWAHGRTGAKLKAMKILPFSRKQLSLHENGLFSDEKEALAKGVSSLEESLFQLDYELWHARERAFYQNPNEIITEPQVSVIIVAYFVLFQVWECSERLSEAKIVRTSNDSVRGAMGKLYVMKADDSLSRFHLMSKSVAKWKGDTIDIVQTEDPCAYTASDSHLCDRDLGVASSSSQNWRIGYFLSILSGFQLFSFEKRVLKRAFRVGLALSASMYFGLIGNDSFAFWAALTVVFVSGPYIGGSFEVALNRLKGTVAGAIFGYLTVSITSSEDVGIVAALSIWSVLCGYIRGDSHHGYAGVTAALTAAIIMLGYVTTDPSDRPDVGDYALARIEQTCLGILVFFIAEMSIFPSRASHQAQERSYEVIASFQEYFKSVFLAYVKNSFGCASCASRETETSQSHAAASKALLEELEYLVEVAIREPQFWSRRFAAGMYLKLKELLRNTFEILNAIQRELEHSCAAVKIKHDVEVLIQPLFSALQLIHDQILESLDSIIMGLKAAEVLRESSQKRIRQILKESAYLATVMPFDCETPESARLAPKEEREDTRTVHSDDEDLESQRASDSGLHTPDTVSDTPVNGRASNGFRMDGGTPKKMDKGSQGSSPKQSYSPKLFSSPQLSFSLSPESRPEKRLKDLHECVKRIREANIRVGPKSAFITFVKAYQNVIAQMRVRRFRVGESMISNDTVLSFNALAYSVSQLIDNISEVTETVRNIIQLETPVDPMSLSVSATDGTHNPFGSPFVANNDDDSPPDDGGSGSLGQGHSNSSASSLNNIAERRKLSRTDTYKAVDMWRSAAYRLGRAYSPSLSGLKV